MALKLLLGLATGTRSWCRNVVRRHWRIVAVQTCTKPGVSHGTEVFGLVDEPVRVYPTISQFVQEDTGIFHPGRKPFHP